MKLSYPSKFFLKGARTALNAHETLEISVQGGWRGGILAKQVEEWPATSAGNRIDGVQGIPPSMACMLLMMPLLTIHFAALSAKYEMRSNVNGNLVVLTYLPL